MRKKIVKVDKASFHGHLMLEFEDNTKQTVFRGDHEAHDPQVGDLWPPEGHEHLPAGVAPDSGRLVKSATPVPAAKKGKKG